MVYGHVIIVRKVPGHLAVLARIDVGEGVGGRKPLAGFGPDIEDPRNQGIELLGRDLLGDILIDRGRGLGGDVVLEEGQGACGPPKWSRLGPLRLLSGWVLNRFPRPDRQPPDWPRSSMWFGSRCIGGVRRAPIDRSKVGLWYRRSPALRCL